VKPVRAVGLANVVSIGAGRLHSLAIERNGSVWAWGDNDLGQLGDGTTANRLAPVHIAAVSGAEEVAGGRDYSVALVKSP
jgi:alpha-tubulin suppressor-like RCC1 family protein